MRQCGAVNDVADGIYAFDIRTVEVVYCYFVTLERDARLFETESFEVRLDADCRKDDVGRKYLFAFFPSMRSSHFPSPFTVTSFTVVPVMTPIFIFRKARSSALLTSVSAAGSSCGRYSITVTFTPSEA